MIQKKKKGIHVHKSQNSVLSMLDSHQLHVYGPSSVTEKKVIRRGPTSYSSNTIQGQAVVAETLFLMAEAHKFKFSIGIELTPKLRPCRTKVKPESHILQQTSSSYSNYP